MKRTLMLVAVLGLLAGCTTAGETPAPVAPANLVPTVGADLQVGQMWRNVHADGSVTLRGNAGVGWTLTIRLNGNQLQLDDVPNGAINSFLTPREDWTLDPPAEAVAK